MPTEFVWLCETEELPPRYATRVRPGWPVELTAVPTDARRFATKDGAQSFCESAYVKEQGWKLVPREHGFG